MTKSELVAIVAQRTGITQAVTKQVIETALHEITNSNGITFRNFGRFERSKRTYNSNLKGSKGQKKEVEKLVFRSKVRY